MSAARTITSAGTKNESSEITVQTSELVKSFGENLAVRGVSFTSQKGELLGLIGPDAAGKTTTLRMLAGLLRPSSGTVEVLGVDPFGRDSDRIRESIGLVPQDHSLYGDLSVEENMRFFSRLYGLGRSEYRQRRERLLAITRLAPFTERRASQLSGGMYKKLALACALLHQPQVLFLDEPTNGVDPVSRGELWELIYEFVAEGMTVLVSTCYMDEAERCHRILLLHQGQIIAEGQPGQLVAELEAPAFEVIGGHREALHELLASLSGVIAASPAGPSLRVLLEPGSTETVAAALLPLGAHLVAARADFEDLFLASLPRGDAS